LTARSLIPLLLIAAGGCAEPVTQPTRPDLPIERSAIEPAAAVIPIGGSVQLRATFAAAALPLGIVWSSSDPTVAEVSMTGLVRARAQGTATILAKAGQVSAQASVRVTIGPSGS
jgi:alpha-amylase